MEPKNNTEIKTDANGNNKEQRVVLNVNDRVSLVNANIFRDDDDNEIPTPAGTGGTVAAVDERPTLTIYEIHWDNGTFLLYSPEQDGDSFAIVPEAKS